MNSSQTRRVIAAGMVGNVLEWYDFLGAVNVSATQRSKSIERICFIYVDLQDVFLLYLQRGNERVF